MLYEKQIQNDSKIIKVSIEDFVEDYCEDDKEDYFYFDIIVHVDLNHVIVRNLKNKHVKYIARKKVSDGEVMLFTKSFDDVYEHLLFSNISDEDIQAIISVVNEYYDYINEQ